jgi:hypothetical protein
MSVPNSIRMVQCGQTDTVNPVCVHFVFIVRIIHNNCVTCDFSKMPVNDFPSVHVLGPV